MTRSRRPRNRATPGMSDIAWSYFMDEVPPREELTEPEREELSVLKYDFFNEGRVGDLWRDNKAIIVEHWMTSAPGTRPTHWWLTEAPEPRHRLGGIGTPCHERLAHAERYVIGVPDPWILRGDIETYARLGTPLDVPALDPANPPMFESEPAYLERLGLLLPGERKRLEPADFEPESLLDIFEFDPAEL